MCSNRSFHCLLLLIVVISLYSCKKKDTPNNTPSPTYTPAVTPVGTPVGNPVSKTIGSNGGSLASSDGRIELSIPAGALSSNTNISIQPATNEAPGGIGLSYHLMPDGTKFAKPATLTYHYTDNDINGTLPYLLYIAYQDSLLQWKADFKKRNVDTIAKTVSLGISHFSIWSMGDRLVMFARPEELHENETSQLTVEHVDIPSQPGAGPDDLPSLPVSSRLTDNAVSNWKVNGKLGGSSQDGTINGSGSQVSYKAPTSIPNTRTVQASAELNYSIVVYNNGNAVSSVNKLILFTTVSLLPNVQNFQFHVEYNKTFLSITNSLYVDSANMDVKVQGGIVTVNNVTNYPLSITPNPVQEGACTRTYLPGPNGYINVLGGSGGLGTDQNNQKIVAIYLSQTGCSEWGYDLSCPPISGLSQHLDPKPITAFLNATFILNNSAQTIVSDQNGGQDKIIYRLTPK